ncbi:MAG: hypothetical protein R2724_20440 [Bryobacterales bacterium]
MGFALPSNIAANVYNQIIKNGRVARGSIGIEFQAEIDEATLRSFGRRRAAFSSAESSKAALRRRPGSRAKM